jgi:hypothetical protein
MEVHAMVITADRKLLAAQNERARRVADGLSRNRPVSSGPITRVQVLASALQRAGHQLQAWRQIRSASAAPVQSWPLSPTHRVAILDGVDSRPDFRDVRHNW